MMQHNNNQTNSLIQWLIIIADFVLLNGVLAASELVRPWMAVEPAVSLLACNMAMMVAEWQFPPIVHQRMVSAGDILKRIVLLTLTQAVVAYIILKVSGNTSSVGRVLLAIGTVLAAGMLLSRFMERSIIKHFRASGKNTRTVIFVGSDIALQGVYGKMIANSTTGYRFIGYYADGEAKWLPENTSFTKIGTIDDLTKQLNDSQESIAGDDIYLCVSRRDGTLIRKLSRYCERHVKRFYFVPIADEAQKVNLRREQIEDLEIYAAYESPLMQPLNKLIKRLFDLVLSSLLLALMLPLFPIIALVIKLQSPGPMFFSQERTGLDGKTFRMLKFRSMHVNDESDTLQATKDDPRKFPFGSWMRSTNVDELPQFWNVFIGDMSIVGPRPHMLAHTEMYSELIDKYMVRHFIKPGITGWAQVTGYRGETRELWQMEGRVKRDIWYMEHWSIWLDIRIIWLTVKSMLVSGDEGAY